MNVTIAGAGGYVPPLVVKNERLVRAIPGWAAERIEEKTGIAERRYLWDFDEERGCTVPPATIEDPGPAGTLAEAALRDALDSAGMTADELDGIVITTCTPDRTNFSHDAMVIHRRLGMRPEAFALVHDDGCGGALFHLALAREHILSGQRKAVAVVGVNCISPLLDRDVYTRTLAHEGKNLGAYLTVYLFGDGAGAVILRAEEGPTPSGIVASYSANEHADLVVRKGGGGMWPAHPAREAHSDPAFYVDGQLVAKSFAPLLRRAIDGALARAGVGLGDITRFYLHQANKRVLEVFVSEAGIPRDRVVMHMERYGNITTAGTLVLLAEDLREGNVALGSGDLVLMAAIGAGAQCAAHVIRL